MTDWPEIEWEDCYPTEDSLASLPTEIDFAEGAKFIRRELARCAENCCASYEESNATDFMDRPVIHAYFSTGGWSGAEDLVGLIESRIDMRHYMLQWRRGGHYIFEFSKDTSP